MISMLDVNSIRIRRRNGEPIAKISRELGISEPTVRKYLRQDDFSPKPPKRKKARKALDPYRDLVRSWLEEDKRTWRKQRHTAKRIFERLRDEEGVEVSRSTVERMVNELRTEMAGEHDAYLDLTWEPGTAQADFGEFDCYVLGVRRKMSFLVLAFPFSNVGFAQVTPGQNAECVCEGLKRIFEHIGGVPTRIVFDNAAGIGRKCCDAVRMTELFGRFAAHYGFEATFCNPYSGHEKGAVESKVGAIRRSLFVPLPQICNVETFNERLLARCEELSGKNHYEKGEPEMQLFVEDKIGCMGLPQKAFDVVRYERHKADKYGKVTVGGRHRYSSDPLLSGQELIVGIGATRIWIYDGDAALISEHARAYGSAPTDSSDPAKQLYLLCHRPGAWKNSLVRADMPDELREYADGLDGESLKSLLRMLRDDDMDAGYTTIITAMQRTLAATGSLDYASVMVSADRIAAGDTAIEYDEPADLDVYDVVYDSGEAV